MSGIVFRKPRPRKQIDLNVTSLVDVLFLLLIFFTLTSTLSVRGRSTCNCPSRPPASPPPRVRARSPSIWS